MLCRFFNESLESSGCKAVRCPDPDPIVWKKPVDGVIKLNWDAAIDERNNRMGVGVIFRDATGAVLASMCSIVPFVTDPQQQRGWLSGGQWR
ncbi:hypothetical protein SLA2020_448330 [Shorea laevis]